MKITITGEIHSSKNSRRVVYNGTRTVVLKSKAAQADEGSMARQLNDQAMLWSEISRDANYPLLVVFHFIRATRSRWDFANMVQGVADAMVKAGYIPDDDVEHFIPVWGGYSVDKQNAGVEFYLMGEV